MTHNSAPKGTFDILPKPPKAEELWKSSHAWSYIEKVMVELAQTYCCRELRTPIFEHTSLFVRSAGETSDIAAKEIYTFFDKKKRSLSLRPEGTAAVMRAFVEHQLHQMGSRQKFFYIGPFFRYDRPQAGRYRQFHQFGVEAIGDASPEQDFETIHMLIELTRRLGLKNLRLELNSLGSSSERVSYKEALIAFLKPHFESLSPLAKSRFKNNPLRLLDSKDPKERSLLKGAPLLLDFLGNQSKERFDKLSSLLNQHSIVFEVNPSLVRGLDYYNHTVFEIISSDLGAQNALGGGGRYDGLLRAFGGQDLPAVGFSVGIERLLIAMINAHCPFPKPAVPAVCLIPLGDEGQAQCLKLLCTLRCHGIASEMLRSLKLPKALQEASKLKSPIALLIGEEEIAKQVVQIKWMETRETREVALSDVVSFLSNHLNPS